MSFDSQAIEQPAPDQDIWKLPEIVSAKAARVSYRKPKIRYEGTRRVEYKQAIEILVETSFEIPARALSPVLYAGDTPIGDYEVAGKNLYRFYVFQPDSIHEGVTLRLEWPQRRGSRTRKPVQLKLGREEVK